MNIELRCKCGKMMQWNNGCVMGAYGPDTENCREPFFYCECGNEVEVSERPPNSEPAAAQNPTSNNNESDAIALYKEAVTLLMAYVDDEECSFDHHGYCQTHGWFEKSECINKQSKRCIEKLNAVIAQQPSLNEYASGIGRDVVQN